MKNSLKDAHSSGQVKQRITLLCQCSLTLSWSCYATTRFPQRPTECVHCRKYGIFLRAVLESNHSAPGIKAKGHTAWCRHMMGVWLLSHYPLPGTDARMPGCWHRAPATGKAGTGGTQHSFTCHCGIQTEWFFGRSPWYCFCCGFRQSPVPWTANEPGI